MCVGGEEEKEVNLPSTITVWKNNESQATTMTTITIAQTYCRCERKITLQVNLHLTRSTRAVCHGRQVTTLGASGAPSPNDCPSPQKQN